MKLTLHSRIQVDHKTTSKANMGRMKEAYAAQKNGEPMPAPPPAKRQRT
jgi:hypothetical protein